MKPRKHVLFVDEMEIPVQEGEMKKMKRLRTKIRKMKKQSKSNSTRPVKSPRLKRSSTTKTPGANANKIQLLEEDLARLMNETETTIKKVPYLDPIDVVAQAMGSPELR